MLHLRLPGILTRVTISSFLTFCLLQTILHCMSLNLSGGMLLYVSTCALACGSCTRLPAALVYLVLHSTCGMPNNR